MKTIPQSENGFKFNIGDVVTTIYGGNVLITDRWIDPDGNHRYQLNHNIIWYYEIELKRLPRSHNSEL